MKKSICCIALALVMALSTVGLFASCTKEKEKTLVMATNANFPPYESRTALRSPALMWSWRRRLPTSWA